ncbi:uncharacterized protein LOC128962320 [Oppia nitens]|uniref:uncharacterized protein LOC128962320 n=1 Tax=Oppia nitens TaxID=1686743 RepID=UPI0023DB3C30|nr:uncharacterized protein LOC128962320 [Oppia nitens]
MTDKSKVEEKVSSNWNVFDNTFSLSLWMTLELSVLYFFTTILIFCGLYAYVWSIQTVGLLAIMHLIAIPVGHIGVRYNKRLLVLLSLLLCAVWFILIIVYVVVFSIVDSVKDSFVNRSLHHLTLFVYFVLNFIIIVLLSINIITDKQQNADKQQQVINVTAGSKDKITTTKSNKNLQK